MNEVHRSQNQCSEGNIVDRNAVNYCTNTCKLTVTLSIYLFMYLFYLYNLSCN